MNTAENIEQTRLLRMLKHCVTAVSRRGSALARWWEDQAWPMRLYSGGGMVMLISLAFGIVGLTYRGLPKTIFIIGALLLAAGIVLEVTGSRTKH